ncbi:hypothetical protein [Nonlabens sp.]|uniref:hypothetical protein n=1 Tax=Nonlabens sp. TaxID=1888209 RepID=UPI001BCE58FD|nr:hypothetical protein [Nonlabens sp.]
MAASDWIYSRSPFEVFTELSSVKKQTTNKVKELGCFLWHQVFGLLSCNEIITTTVMPHKSKITVKNGLTFQSRNDFETTSKNNKFEYVMSIV